MANKKCFKCNENRIIESNLKYSQNVMKIVFGFLRAYIHEEYEFKKSLSPEERAEMRATAEKIQIAAQKSDAAFIKDLGKGIKFFNSSLKNKVVLIWKVLKNPEELKSKINVLIEGVKLYNYFEKESALAELKAEVENRAKKDELELQLIEADNAFELAKRKIELEHERALKNLEEEEESYDPDTRAEPKTK